MPGITGIIEKIHKTANAGMLNVMLDTMMHENFYSRGTYSNEDLGVHLGWACHKDSFSDCMPVWNEKKNIVLIYFGEDYADPSLFSALKANHHEFRQTDAGYIIHMYEDKGIDFLQDLNGWFSGVLVDLNEGKIILFNDRYGMQRIYYHEGKDAFFFSSEAKTLLKICPELRRIDMKSLGEYFCCDCVMENRTLFNNVFLLPFASAWIFQKNGSIRKDRYFIPGNWENQPCLDKETFYEALKETYNRVLPKYLRSEQTVGISLTGGFDTRMLMACADMAPDKYPCYTFGSMYRDNNDVKIARKVAAIKKQPYYVLTLDKDFLTAFPKYAERTVYISDGYADVGMSPEIYVNELARKIAPVRLTGNYGSEILRSSAHFYRGNPNTLLFSPDFMSHLQDSAATFRNIIQTVKNPLSLTSFAETPWLENIRFTLEQSQLTLRSPYLDNDLVGLIYRSPLEVRKSNELSFRLIWESNRNLWKIRTDRGVSDYLVFPFSTFVHLYHEFFFKADYAYNYGMPQWLAVIDHAFKYMHFEKLFLGRHKFNHFRLWYRDELAGYVKDILLDARTMNRPYLNKKYLSEIVLGHTKGNRNYTTAITKMLTVELMQRLLIE